MNRRAFVGAAALTLAGCGDKRFANQSLKAAQKRTVAIDYASYYAPIEDVRRLVGARAAQLGAQLTLSDDPGGISVQRDNLKRWTGPRGAFKAIAVAPFDAAALSPVVAAADGVAVVSYITPIKGQRAGITVDFEAAGAKLAALAPPGPVLLVIPIANADTTAIPNPFAHAFTAAANAIESRRPVALRVSASAADDGKSEVAAALDARPEIRSVLCWNDESARGAATVAGDRFVGALGAPSLASAKSISALRSGHIDALVTPRLRDLTHALVDLPLRFARGEDAGSVTVPFAVLRPHSRALRAFASDFTS